MGSELAAGSVIADRYRLESLLGKGGMGVVWAARSLDSDAPVAVKLMKASEEDPKVRRRFLREARAAAALEHPNVVRVIEVLELADGQPAIVMERLTGEPLSSRLSGPLLGVEETARILLSVVSAVGMAHALGIVHRDLKPENIFLSRTEDGTEVVKVLDFGIAKVHADDGGSQMIGATTTGALLGTPSYMSPEQVFGERDIDYRADVWSLGMILYECLSGVLPTQAENVGQILKLILTRDDWHFEEVAPDAPDDLKDIVSRSLRRSRAERPDLAEVSRVLGAHTSAAAPSFGPPAIRGRADFPPKDTPIDRLALGLAETMSSGSGSGSGSNSRASTNGATTASTLRSERRSNWPVAGAIVIVGLLGIGTWRLTAKPDAPSPEPSALPATISSALPRTESPPAVGTAQVQPEAHASARPDGGAPPAPAPAQHVPALVARPSTPPGTKPPRPSAEPAPAASAPPPAPRAAETTDPLDEQH